jgi:long-subunit fatty acid transport protein
MIKKISALVFLLITSISWSQDNTASPYSYYGLGEIKFKGTHDVRAMGGVSVFNDSIQLNIVNPASFSKLKSTAFTIGANSSFSKYNTNEVIEKAQRTNIDYLAVGFPYGKFGFTFGIMPYSAVGFKIENTAIQIENNVSTQRNYRNLGEGNVNKIYFGAAYSINKKLSFGFDLGYNFGDITTQYVESIYSPIVLQLRSREKNNSKINGISLNTGFLYKTKINSKLDLNAGITYQPEATLTSENDRKIATVIYNINGAELISEEKDIPVNDTKLKIPTKFSFGLGIGENKKWAIGSELTFANNSVMTNRFGSIPNVSFENSTKVAVGGFYVPKYDSFSNYLSRIIYRGGFRYENTGLVINNQSINDYAVTFGLGLPVGLSKINLGVELGKRGTTTSGLIEENYINVTVGLSLSDLWFIKRKID